MITARRISRKPLLESVEAALAGGADCVQLREKDLSGHDLYQLARELRTLTAHAGVPLVINDRADLALAVRAHGVHLGAGSIPVPEARRLLKPGDLIGYSAHSVEEAQGAALAGADYVFFAPVFEPGSKEPAAASAPVTIQGPEALWHAAAVSPIPVYALGGINLERLRFLMAPPPGAGRPPQGAAVISAILAAPDPAEAARELRAALP